MLNSVINLGLGAYGAAMYGTFLAGGAAISVLQKTGITQNTQFRAGVGFAEDAGYGFLDLITRHQVTNNKIWTKPSSEELRQLFDSI